MNEESFRAELKEQGYQEVGYFDFAEDQSFATHSHDWETYGLVLEGEYILKTDDSEVRHGVGEMCKIAANFDHGEAGGPAGARILYGKKFA